MSLIAESWIIHTNKLEGLVQATEFTKDSWLWFKWTTDNYYPYLKKHGRELKQEEIPGIIYDQVLDFLHESLALTPDQNELSGMSHILSEKRQARIMLIPHSIRDELIAKTDPERIDHEALAAFIDYIQGNEARAAANRQRMELNAHDDAEEGEETVVDNVHITALRVFRNSLMELKSNEDVLYFAIA